jgi:hypothetical protein
MTEHFGKVEKEFALTVPGTRDRARDIGRRNKTQGQENSGTFEEIYV